MLVAHPAVSEAAAIGVADSVKGEAVVCFCVLKAEANGDEKLAEELKEKVARDLGKPLRPAVVKFVADLPKTRNAKVMRRVIRAAYLGKEPGDLSALENPQSVEEFRKPVKSKKKGGSPMPIITIYQGASGSGQELAEAVAKTLGYRCVGREVLVDASRRYGIPEAKLNDLLEKGPHWWERLLQDCTLPHRPSSRSL